MSLTRLAPASLYVSSYYLPSLDAAVRSFKMVSSVVPVHTDAEIEMVMTSLGHGPKSGLVAMPHSLPGRQGCHHPCPPQIRTRQFPASGSSRESFADDVMDDRIGRPAHRHSLLGQTFSISRQFGYPCRIVNTGYRVQSPPVFLDMVLSSRRLPSLLRVPASLVPRSRRYYEGATTSHLRISGRLFCSLPLPT
jgi:hypothetical protein